MKTKTLVLISAAISIVTLVTASPVLAQKGSFELGAGIGLTSLDDKLGGDSGASLDLRAGYFVTDRFEIEIQSAYASSIVEGSFKAYTLNALYHFDVEGDFVPYLLAGVGEAQASIDHLFAPSIEDNGTALRGAIGGRFEIGQPGGVFSRMELSALNEDSFDEDETHIGITLLFGWNFGN
jgi:opacity protein-like surface antigen